VGTLPPCCSTISIRMKNNQSPAIGFRSEPSLVSYRIRRGLASRHNAFAASAGRRRTRVSRPAPNRGLSSGAACISGRVL
jgi:hypothetical protein